MLFATLKLTELWLSNLADAYFLRLDFEYESSCQLAVGLHECSNAFLYFIQPSTP